MHVAVTVQPHIEAVIDAPLPPPVRYFPLMDVKRYVRTYSMYGPNENHLK